MTPKDRAGWLLAKPPGPLHLNVQDDGREVSPWTGSTGRVRYGVSKLAQWDVVFSHMTRKGLSGLTSLTVSVAKPRLTVDVIQMTNRWWVFTLATTFVHFMHASLPGKAPAVT